MENPPTRSSPEMPSHEPANFLHRPLGLGKQRRQDRKRMHHPLPLAQRHLHPLLLRLSRHALAIVQMDFVPPPRTRAAAAIPQNPPSAATTAPASDHSPQYTFSSTHPTNPSAQCPASRCTQTNPPSIANPLPAKSQMPPWAARSPAPATPTAAKASTSHPPIPPRPRRPPPRSHLPTATHRPPRSPQAPPEMDAPAQADNRTTTPSSGSQAQISPRACDGSRTNPI